MRTWSRIQYLHHLLNNYCSLVLQTHGTTLNGKPLAPNKPTQVKQDAVLQFGTGPSKYIVKDLESTGRSAVSSVDQPECFFVCQGVELQMDGSAGVHAGVDGTSMPCFPASQRRCLSSEPGRPAFGNDYMRSSREGHCFTAYEGILPATCMKSVCGLVGVMCPNAAASMLFSHGFCMLKALSNHCFFCSNVQLPSDPVRMQLQKQSASAVQQVLVLGRVLLLCVPATCWSSTRIAGALAHGRWVGSREDTPNLYTVHVYGTRDR